MRIPTTRTFAVLATATMLLGGVTSSAGAGDAGPSVAKPVTSVIWCRQANALMRQVWTRTACNLGESKYVLRSGSGPRGPRGVQGPTGATGPAGATGARGPSDLYHATLAPLQVVGDTSSTFATAAVPAGSYQVQFTAYLYNSTADQNVVCAVFPSSGPPLNLPVTRATLSSSPLAEAPISAIGWYVSAAGTTFRLACAVSGTGQTATLGELSMTALQVGTIH